MRLFLTHFGNDTWGISSKFSPYYFTRKLLAIIFFDAWMSEFPILGTKGFFLGPVEGIVGSHTIFHTPDHSLIFNLYGVRVLRKQKQLGQVFPNYYIM